jgi:hypothetical protein
VLAGNPWEIERLIVSYPIKFYGHVSTHTEEGRQVRERHGFQGNSCNVPLFLNVTAVTS